MVVTQDGSNTLYSSHYSQHYHSIKDGALSESMYKHVIPALEHHKGKDTLHILDICFGLGYNTWTTLYYLQKYNRNKTIHVYSPELDENLIRSLQDFSYPKEFDFLQNIIHEVSQKGCFHSDALHIEIFIGDAREYVRSLNNIDIIYQDAFSSDVNKELWTAEYFKDIHSSMDSNGILTTYSIATPVRMGLHVNGFYLQEYRSQKTRKGTLAFKKPMENCINMELKQKRNPQASALYDT